MKPKPAKMFFVRYYPENFHSGVVGLTQMQELAYRRICELIYISDDALADDDVALAEMTRTFGEWPAVKAVLLAKLKVTVENGFVKNERCTIEIGRAKYAYLGQSKAGKASAKKRRKSGPRKGKVRSVGTERVTENEKPKVRSVPTELVTASNYGLYTADPAPQSKGGDGSDGGESEITPRENGNGRDDLPDPIPPDLDRRDGKTVDDFYPRHLTPDSGAEPPAIAGAGGPAPRDEPTHHRSLAEIEAAERGKT